MATWSFRDALEELELQRQLDDSMLKSEAGLHLGDVRFAELQTTIKMRSVRLSTFLHYIEDGAFNPDIWLPTTAAKRLPYLSPSSLAGISRILRTLESAV